MDTPRFSVVIPTLNEEKFLPKLLTSLIRQTVKDFEVIVVDGSSADRTVAVARRFMKRLPMLQVIVSDISGVSRQRNMGAKIAKGTWLVFVDADSVLLPNFFDRITRYIGRKKPKFFTTWFRADVDDPAHAIAGFLGNMSVEGALIIGRPWAPGPLTVVYRSVFDQSGGYDEDASFSEDHDFSMKIVRRGVAFQILREVLYKYSFRRFRKEGPVRALKRYARSTLAAAITKRVPKHMPGFVAGGSIYETHSKKKKTNTK